MQFGLNNPDTIFAVATGAARAAIAVVRLSGPRSHDALHAMIGRRIPTRVATLVRLRDPATRETLDHCLVLAFDGARSETGEDGAELHLHGSPAVVRAVLRSLAAQAGLRPAEPGEFARRAFHAGKIDLAQLEGLADLIDAETDWQRRQAQRQASGAIRDAVAPWREALLEASADVETMIDFIEDVDLASDANWRLERLLMPIRESLRRELAHSRGAERMRDGVQVVIAGPPNAGKSTLLNVLAGRDAAIVSAVAGTTRDPIEVHLDLGGFPATLVDTAGLRDSEEEIERLGISRARRRIEEADLVLWLGGSPPVDFPEVTWWPISAKSDLAAVEETAASPLEGDAKAGGSLRLSAKTGDKIDVLLARLEDFARATMTTSGVIARARHRQAFEAALAALDRIEAGPLDPEFVAEELRLARDALDRLIGAIGAEDVLGSIFSRFCIGK